MIIDTEVLDTLSAEARMSPRLRMNLDLRNGEADQSQRMLNAIEPGAILPIHRHRHSSETVVILRGHMQELFYDKLGQEIEVIDLVYGSEILALNIPKGQWHTAKALQSGTVILEMKDGPYVPIGPEDILNHG